MHAVAIDSLPISDIIASVYLAIVAYSCNPLVHSISEMHKIETDTIISIVNTCFDKTSCNWTYNTENDTFEFPTEDDMLVFLLKYGA